MTAKEYLLQYRDIQEEIASIMEQIEEIESFLGYHPVQLDDVGGSRSNYREDKMSEYLAKVADLYTELQEKSAKLIVKKNEIREEVDTLSDPNEKKVLTLRYLTPHPKKIYAPLGWREIGRRMNYSPEGAKKVHQRALINFQDRINKEYPKVDTFSC